MSSATTTTPLLSSSQRRCQLLLMLYLSDPLPTLDALCRLNGVDPSLTRLDLAAVAAEIQHYHQLDVHVRQDGCVQLQGSELNKRLCLLFGMRRALRIVPEFVHNVYAPALRQCLQAKGIERLLYDRCNLQALTRYCAKRLQRKFSTRDDQFLQLYIQFSLCHPQPVTFTPQQQQWLARKAGQDVAHIIVRHWQRRCRHTPDNSETDFWTLLFSMMHTPCATTLLHTQEQQLMSEVKLLIQRFETLSGMCFPDNQSLSHRLYTHLVQALDRCLFTVGIDKGQACEIARLYPRLTRVTQCAIAPFESCYGVHFSSEEQGLITVIFGAWLMQAKAASEKQILLLTGHNTLLEKEVEQHLRELTLLPLSIRYQSVKEFKHQGAPENITLVVTPYATPMPLYSPPLIHTGLPLNEHQQQRIRTLLEP